MKRLATTGASGLTVTLLFASGAPAGMIDIGGGWRAAWAPSLDPYVSLELLGVDGDSVHIRKLAEFIQPPPLPGFPFPAIPITFTQTSVSAVHNIVIDEELITNSTGRPWTDFHMEILNGHEAFFDPAATAASGGPGPIGFDVSPFTSAAFGGSNHVLDIWGGLVPNGTQWSPGSGANGGALWLNVVTGDGVNSPMTVFTLKETPTPTPASLALMGLAGGVAASTRRRR